MTPVFVDTDVCLDLLSKREPFYEYSAQLFMLSEQKRLKIYVSSLTFSHIYYLLTRLKVKGVRDLLIKFKKIVSVLPVDEKIIASALASAMPDFEDAIQYYAALGKGVTILLTRNTKDYGQASLVVMTPQAYCETLKET